MKKKRRKQAAFPSKMFPRETWMFAYFELPTCSQRSPPYRYFFFAEFVKNELSKAPSIFIPAPFISLLSPFSCSSPVSSSSASHFSASPFCSANANPNYQLGRIQFRHLTKVSTEPFTMTVSRRWKSFPDRPRPPKRITNT